MELLSEEEQWERLKAWMRQNVPFVLGLAAIGVLAYFALDWWKSHKDDEAVQASVQYEEVLKTFDSGKLDDALKQIETLRKAHPKSAYTSAADLAAAKVFVLQNNLDKAVERLERVMNEAPDLELRPIARLRLARVLSAQGQYDKALAVLGAVDSGSFKPAFLEARGDVLLAKGDKGGALQEYESARKLLPENQQGTAGVGELLDLKINDLRASAAVPEAPAKP
ncbi:MAG TPA: tetratricopeptide repeat protein [Steroidobacteraceae bacterium]|nr:tetratricopeptide repeat protein [Steroidobacteraceae bacterium]